MIDKKSNNLTIAVTPKAYELAKAECLARKASGLASSITAIASEAIVAKFGENGEKAAKCLHAH